MDRIVDISSDGLHLAIHRGFLTVSKSGEEQGRIALDDIGALITHAYGLTWTNHVFVMMAERNIPVVLCAANHAPVSVVWPLDGHHMQGGRLRAQLAAPRPLQKQLWQKIVASKIRMQGRVLEANGKQGSGFDLLARKVRSGDPDNVEAQAARRYWKALFGEEFSRDRQADNSNALLNYGYTILRALVCRAICGSGLHPTMGIFHSSKANNFALADDLMEPYRPLVDQMVWSLTEANRTELDRETKDMLTKISTFDLQSGPGLSPLSVQVSRFVHSLATSFESGQAELELPELPSLLELSGLGRPCGEPE